MTENGVQYAPVFVTTAIMTSAGRGPGVRYVPLAEAAHLVRDRRAVYGTQPPRGYSDGGGTGRAN